MLRDILRDTEPYQRILEEGRAEGCKEGREEALEEGVLKGKRQILLMVVQSRFPDLLLFAKVQVETIKDPVMVDQVIVELINVQTEEAVLRLLLDIGKSKEKN